LCVNDKKKKKKKKKLISIVRFRRAKLSFRFVKQKSR